MRYEAGDFRASQEKRAAVRRPVLIFCHDIGQTKEEMIPRMEAAARRGYIAACIDARYHGESSSVTSVKCSAETKASRAAVHDQLASWLLMQRYIGCATHAGGRAETPYAFKNALLKAWREGGNKGSESKAAYVLDTLWDLVILLDFLELRPDVDPVHIGATGIGIGALQCAMLVAVDCRVAAAAPMMGLTHVRANVADFCNHSWFDGWLVFSSRRSRARSLMIARRMDATIGTMGPGEQHVAGILWVPALYGIFGTGDEFEARPESRAARGCPTSTTRF